MHYKTGNSSRVIKTKKKLDGNIINRIITKKKKFALLKLCHIHFQKYMIQELTCWCYFLQQWSKGKCHNVPYISGNLALKSSQVINGELLVNDPIRHVKGCSIFKMTSYFLTIKPPHDPKGCILVLTRTPLKINISTNYNKLEGDFTFIVVKLHYNENIARNKYPNIAGYKVKKELKTPFLHLIVL